MDDVYRFCCGELGLTIPEADALTVYELNRRMEWYSRKEDAMWHKIRVLASIVIQPHLKKTIRPEDLIQLPDDVKKPTMTREEISEDVQRKTKEFLRRWQRRFT